MGDLWRARDTRLSRDVAIRILPDDLGPDAPRRMRFEREVRTIARLDHPNVAKIVEVGDHYVALDLDGESLEARMKRGPLPGGETVRYGREITEGLEAAHRAGIVHRELSARSVMLTSTGAKLFDFGLAKAVDVDENGDIVARDKLLAAMRSVAAAASAADRRPRAAGATWIIVVAVLVAIAAWFALKPKPVAEVITASIATDGNSGPRVRLGPPVFSPDGKWLVYAAADAERQRRLWLRSMEHGTTQPLAGTNDAFLPFWSADGRYIGFTVLNGEVKRYAMSDRAVESIAVKTNGAWTWNRDDVILCVNASVDAIQQLSLRSKKKTDVLRGASIGASLTAWPSFLPDGNRFLFHAKGTGIQNGLWAATLDGSEPPRFITHASSHGVYVEPETLLYVRDGALRARRFDPKRLTVGEGEETIAPVRTYESGKDVFALFAATKSLIVWAPPSPEGAGYELVLKRPNGDRARTIADTAFFDSPRVSPDGRRVVVDRSDGYARGDIWLLGIHDATATKFSSDRMNETAPVWSPRGDEIAWVLDLGRSGSRLLRRREGEKPRDIVTTPDVIRPTDWSPDGDHLALNCVTRRSGGGVPNTDVIVWSFSEARRIEVTSFQSNEAHGVFSPDGKWIAYQSDESGRYEIYVQPFPPNGTKVPVSTGGGTWPRWRRDGAITYADADHRLVVSFRHGPPQPLFPLELPENAFRVQYDLTPSGEVVSNEPVRGSVEPMKLLINWRRKLD